MNVRPASAAAVIAAWLSAAAPSAQAGSYDVLACARAPNGENASWASSNDSGSTLETGQVCPPSGSASGLFAHDILAGSDTLAGKRAGWAFAAPAGTTITRLRAWRNIGKKGEQRWRPAAWQTDGTVIETCDIPLGSDQCFKGADGYSPSSYLDMQLNTTSVTYGIRCDASDFCTNGTTLHSAWAYLYGAEVTLSESVEPNVGAPSGPLATDSGWHSGTEGVGFSGSDLTGIRESRVYVDNVLVSSLNHACDYTRKLPCSDLPDVTHSVDTTRVADGRRELQVAVVDAAGNEQRSSPVTIGVDNGPPTDVAIASSGSGSRIDVSWSATDAASGVQSYDVEVSRDFGPWEPWLTGTTQTSASYTGVHRSGYAFRVRARDALGHVSGYAGVDSHFVDDPPPSADSGSSGAGSGGDQSAASTATPPATTTGAPPAAGPGPAMTGKGAGDGGTSRPATPPTRATPALRISSVRRRGTLLRLRGRLPRRARGVVTATYTASVGRRAVRVRRRARVRRGAFHIALRMPRAVRTARRVRIVVRYGGDRRYRPRTLRAAIRR